MELIGYSSGNESVETLLAVGSGSKILDHFLFTILIYCSLFQASRAGYGILIIVVYWVTEVCPLAVTSMLPLAIFPLLGVLTSQDAASAYLQNANVLFIGGLLVFVSFEEWNLHKRIALKVLLLIGTRKQK